MEILSTDDESPELVTNLEVMQILAQAASNPNNKKKKKQRKAQVQHVDWIQQHVSDYLQNTPCAQIIRGNEMPILVKKLKEDFGLTDAETLQILNFMPRESVEIHLIIQDLPLRLTEERQEELLTLIGTYVNDVVDKNGDKKPAAKEETVFNNGKLKEEEMVENGDTVILEEERKDTIVKTEPS